MAPAHSKDLAWRVVFRYHWHDQTSPEICDPKTGLDVSPHYVRDVLARYAETGDVETHQGQGADHWQRRVFTYAEDLHIIQLLVMTPSDTQGPPCTVRPRVGHQRRVLVVLRSRAPVGLHAQEGGFHARRATRHTCLGTRKPSSRASPLSPGSAFASQIRALSYSCDREKARAWLAEVLTFHTVWELGVLDETSKDFDTLKGAFGYSIRGTVCSAHDQVLSHNRVRTSALCLYTVQDGFLDWAMTPGTFNREYFMHVTTENFVDWHGVRRRPMLVRRGPVGGGARLPPLP